jgi:hypothetical protein
VIDIEDVEEREDPDRRKNLERDDAKDVSVDELGVEAFSEPGDEGEGRSVVSCRRDLRA